MSHVLNTLDYRESHLRPGASYDQALAEVPFDTFLAARETEILPALASRLFPGGVARYLDFACGSGRITQLLEPLARESYGIDVSAGMLERARQKCPRTTFLLHDVTRQDLNVEPFPLVTACRFFGNAQDDLRRDALQALHRLVAERGYLILDNHRNPHSLQHLLARLRGRRLPNYHGRPMDLGYWKMRRLLASAGFRLVSAHGIGFWVLRGAWMRTEVLFSPVARALEPLSRLPFFVPICPAAILVAQRMAARPRTPAC